MSEIGDIESVLESLPLDKLNIGTRLYRALKNRGVSSLYEALHLEEREIEEFLSGAALREYDRLYQLYQRDPAKLLQAVAPHSHGGTAVVESGTVDEGLSGVRGRPAGKFRKGTLRQIRLYEERFGEFEDRARRSLGELDDHREEALIAECFGGLSAYMEQAQDDFAEYFRRRHRKRDVEDFATSFPSTFLVLVSRLASREFDGDGLWGNLFEELGIGSLDVQTTFKRLFASMVARRGLPTFAEDDVNVPYYYTALFHGGLSQNLWEPLWKNSALRYADEMIKAGRRSPTRADAYGFLVEARDDDGLFYARRKVTDNILEKASDEILIPLMLSVLEVAIQVQLGRNDIERGGSGFEMLSDNGLPDVAMAALRRVLEDAQPGRAGKKRVVYLPRADARLDMGSGRIVLRWPAQRFPLSFKGYEIDYEVNGELLHTQSFGAGVGKCLLDEVEIPVTPSDHIETTLVLRGLGSGQGAEMLSTLTQVFKRSKPGVYEFARNGEGEFLIRRQGARVRRETEIAYLVSGRFDISPGPGMRLLDSIGETPGEQGGPRILIYSVTPGATGSVVNRASGEEVAVWQENLQVEINRDYILGRTGDGRDLYGRIAGNGDANPALPAIVVHSLGAGLSRADLDVACSCDGKRVHLLAKSVEADARHAPSESSVLVAPYETTTMPWLVDDGEIRITNRRTGRPVVRYRFSVLPIGSYSLSSLSWGQAGLVGRYRFQTWLDVRVDDLERSVDLPAHASYEFEMALGEDNKAIRVSNVKNGISVSAVLNAAGIRVRMDERLREVSAHGRVSILDSEEASGRLEIEAVSKRRGRGVYARLGDMPLFYRELDGPGTCSFDVFDDAGLFEWANGAPRDLPLVLSVSFGGTSCPEGLRPASADVVLLSCESGFGLGGWRMVLSGGQWAIRFERPARADLGAVFLSRRGGELGRSDLPEGETTLPLPASAASKVSCKRYCRVEIAPCDLFGDFDEERSMPIDLTDWGKR